MFKSKKQYAFHMKEKDVTEIISVINKSTSIYKFSMGNCGWADDKDMWFVHFEASKKEYRNIMIELCKIGTMQLDEACRVYFTKK